jgi:hypothetical protein
LFTETSIRRSLQIPILVVFAVLLISMLVLIQDLDRPFAGRYVGVAASGRQAALAAHSVGADPGKLTASLARNVGMYGL